MRGRTPRRNGRRVPPARHEPPSGHRCRPIAPRRRTGVVDQERALADLPQQLDLGLGEAEQVARPVQLVGRLRLDDRVSASARRPSARRASRVPSAPAAQVGEAVHDDDVLDPVGARMLEGVLQPLTDAEVAEDPPRLIDDDDQLVAAGAVGRISLAAAPRSTIPRACKQAREREDRDDQPRGTGGRAVGSGRPAA